MASIGPIRSSRAISSAVSRQIDPPTMAQTASDAMMKLMQRPLDPMNKDENQVKEFIGESLPAGSKLWSKAGWTSEVRHDAAYVELPGGKKYVMVIFTRGTADDVTLIPAIAKRLLVDFQ